MVFWSCSIQLHFLPLSLSYFKPKSGLELLVTGLARIILLSGLGLTLEVNIYFKAFVLHYLSDLKVSSEVQIKIIFCNTYYNPKIQRDKVI